MIDGIERQSRGESYGPVAGQFMIDGMIAESGLSVDTTGSEELAAWDVDWNAQFFGPNAAEIGRLVSGTISADNFGLVGYIGASEKKASCVKRGQARPSIFSCGSAKNPAVRPLETSVEPSHGGLAASHAGFPNQAHSPNQRIRRRGELRSA